MSKIETGRFSSLLRRFLHLKGQEVVADELAPELSGVFVLESDRPDWLFLKGERMVSFGNSLVFAAANGSMRFRNPLNSGVLATFDRFEIHLSAMDENIEIRLRANNADLTGVAAATLTDTRDNIAAASIIPSSQAAVPPAGSFIWFQELLQGNNPITVDRHIVLSPGNQINIGISAAVTGTMFVSACWSERPLPLIEAL